MLSYSTAIQPADLIVEATRTSSILPEDLHGTAESTAASTNKGVSVPVVSSDPAEGVRTAALCYASRGF